MSELWRQGRRVLHHVYAQSGDAPADTDRWIGSFVDPYDAQMAVKAMNLAERLLGIDRALTAVVDQWTEMGQCYIGAEQNAALADLLDALVARMPEGQG